MGNTSSVNKLNYQDMQKAIYNKNCFIINTLDLTNQECLILNTISPQQEEIIINDYLNKNKNISIIIYGENCNDNKLLNQYNKLINLGLLIFMYILVAYLNGYYYKIFLVMRHFQQQKKNLIY